MTSSSASRSGFTLVELLVVIGIVALLIAILLPSLSAARQQALSVANLSNMRQLGLGLEMYRNDAQGRFPQHSSLKDNTTNVGLPRTRWADALYPYVESEAVFLAPQLTDDELIARMRKPFAHTVEANPGGSPVETDDTVYYGGYGYNYQYLGNSRTAGGSLNAYAATAATVSDPSNTVAFADTKGARDGDPTLPYGHGGSGVYVVDPPLHSVELGSRGSRKNADPVTADDASGNAAYEGGDAMTDDVRATPAARNKETHVGITWADGHGSLLTPEQLDDRDGDGEPDNGYWNGRGDSTRR